jgi:ATP-dependent DNA helicase RecG
MQEEMPDWMKGLNERQIKAMEYVSQHGQMTNREYQEFLSVSRSTAKKELQALVLRGLLQQKGTGRSAHYVVAEKLGISMTN